MGDGPLRARLEQLSRDLGLHGRVEFAGHSSCVEAHLRRARILVMASAHEGFPFAIVEAFCCGVVTVTTRVGTIDEVIRDGETGLLVEPGDPEALADAALRLLNDPILFDRLRANALALRPQFAYSRATAAWAPWLSSLTLTPLSNADAPPPRAPS